MPKKKKLSGDLNNRELLSILMQEIADVHRELDMKITGVHTSLKQELTDVHTSLKQELTDVRDEVQASRAESHQNQVAFITNIQDHERRITVLERR